MGDEFYAFRAWDIALDRDRWRGSSSGAGPFKKSFRYEGVSWGDLGNGCWRFQVRHPEVFTTDETGTSASAIERASRRALA